MGAACQAEGAAHAKARSWEVASLVGEEETGLWGWGGGEAGWGFAVHGEGLDFVLSSSGCLLEDRNGLEISSAGRATELC